MQPTNHVRYAVVVLVSLWLCGTSAAEDVTERAVPSDPRFQQSLSAIPAQTPEQQIVILQQHVQALQAQMAALQSVLKIATDGSVTILSPMSISVQAGRDVSVGAGRNVSIGAGQNSSIHSAGTALVEGKSGLDLKGQVVKLNGGTKPIATVGSQVQVPGQPIGQISTGSGTILGN